MDTLHDNPSIQYSIFIFILYVSYGILFVLHITARYCILWMMRFSSKKVLCHIIVGLNVTSFLPIISLQCRKLDDSNNNICGCLCHTFPSFSFSSFIHYNSLCCIPPPPPLAILTYHSSWETTTITTIVDWYHNHTLVLISPTSPSTTLNMFGKIICNNFKIIFY